MTAFPAALDAFAPPGDTLADPPHHLMHAALNAAVAAVQAKLGVDNSADAGTVDYKLAHLAPVATSGRYADLTDKPAPGGVTTAFGRTGAVTAQTGDYTIGQIYGTGALAAKSKAALGADVTGLLPITNGGTQAATVTNAQINLISGLEYANPDDYDGYASAWVAWHDTVGGGAYAIDLYTFGANFRTQPQGSVKTLQYNYGYGNFAAAEALTYSTVYAHLTILNQDAGVRQLVLKSWLAQTVNILELANSGNTPLYGFDKVGRPFSGVTVPTLTAGTGAGASPTLAVTGTDVNGQLTLTTGSSPAANATALTLTFSTPYAAAPKSVLPHARQRCCRRTNRRAGGVC